MSKYEKTLLCIFLLLSSFVISYNLFYVPKLPNLDVVKEEVEVKTEEKNNKEENQKKLININSADEEDLKKIPGVGPSIAKRIIEYREQNGGFSSISEIMNVSGIGKSKFKAMKDNIYVDWGENIHEF